MKREWASSTRSADCSARSTRCSAGSCLPRAWERYIGEIVDVRSRLGESELIVAERAGRLVGTIGFYPIEIGEMFTGRPLPPGQSWQTQAYRLDVEGV